jgi:transposase
VVPGTEGAEAPSLEVMLAEALEANRQLSELAGGLAEENARLRARDAEREAEFERMRADLALLQRMLFGRSSEKARPEAPGGGGPAGARGEDAAGTSKGVSGGRGRGRGGVITRACRELR